MPAAVTPAPARRFDAAVKQAKKAARPQKTGLTRMEKRAVMALKFCEAVVLPSAVAFGFVMFALMCADTVKWAKAGKAICASEEVLQARKSICAGNLCDMTKYMAEMERLRIERALAQNCRLDVDPIADAEIEMRFARLDAELNMMLGAPP